jgi:hypothetical protein
MSENIDRLSSMLSGRFTSSHVLLYVGQGVSLEELRGCIARERWSAVITTIREEGFPSLFSTDSREPWECNSRSQLSSRALSRERPPIIQLLGVDGVEPDIDDDLLLGPSGRGDNRLERAEELLRVVPSLLGYTNHLVVVGVDSDDDLGLLEDLGRLLLKEAVPGSVSFWGMDESFSNRENYRDWLRKICERMSFEYHGIALSEVLRRRQAEESASIAEVEGAGPEDDIFFCNHVPVTVRRDDLLRIRSVGTLLTERTVNRVRPLGRVQQRLWFSNFLELSGVGEPQWYGYLPQSSFHVKRDYEDALTLLVRRALRGQGLGDVPLEDKPIILTGAPGSSKSVTLGALAYRVYNERISPVLFISGNAFQGSGFGGSFRRLVDSLETIQRAVGGNAPVLVVWDGSSYREIEADARDLLTRLKNRGRNVVLVCSSYSLGGDNLPSASFSLDRDADAFVRSEDDDADVVHKAGCFFVKSTRLMSEKEQYLFWQRASNYAGIPTEQIAFLKARMKEELEPDIFNYYYNLVSLLRKRLEDSLEGEQDKVTRFLEAEMPDYFKSMAEKEERSRESSPMWQAFLKAGMTMEQLNAMARSDTVDESFGKDDGEWSESLVRANSFIALFSRYKLDTPYSLVYPIVTKRGEDNPFSEEGRELFDVLTTKIPWLICGENDDEEYVFRFRNSLEADIFLSRHGIDGPKLVDMAIEALELYGSSYQRNQYDDPRLASKLQALIRLMGPNSKYYNGRKRDEHIGILACLNRLIDAIDRLLVHFGIPDEDSGFTLLLVTLSREYYGRNVWERLHKRQWDESDYDLEGYHAKDYEARLEKINRASALALASEQKLEQIIGLRRGSGQEDYLSRQANALIVESTRCSLEAEELRTQYAECCRLTGSTPKSGCVEEPQPYIVQFHKLESVIRRDPVNGYAYNAMFSLFEKEYKKPWHTEEDRLEFLTEVMAFVQDCLTLGDEIVNRGDHSDELYTHIAKIGSLAEKIPVSIETIEDGSASESSEVFSGIYHRFLEEGNPAAILFVCRKEIGDALGAQGDLSDAARMRCRRVLEFMKEPRRFACICSDAGALATLIRVTWMAHSGHQLSATRECQTTSFSDAQWHELYQYCSRYSRVAPMGTQQPLILLIYALSSLQIGGRDVESYIAAQRILQQIAEEQFVGQYRMRTPFIVCDEDGRAYRYTGTVQTTRDRTGFMRVNGMPYRLGNADGVRYYLPNLGRNHRPLEVGDVVSDLELGVGYLGFSLYKEEGCAERRRNK